VRVGRSLCPRTSPGLFASGRCGRGRPVGLGRDRGFARGSARRVETVSPEFLDLPVLPEALVVAKLPEAPEVPEVPAVPAAPEWMAFIRRRNPKPTRASRVVGTARKITSLPPEDPEFRDGMLMASMVEPAELSGCVCFGAEAVVVGAEVLSAVGVASAISEFDPDPPRKALDEKSGELCAPKDP
jgi:hypothetical protein